jgi:flagellin
MSGVNDTASLVVAFNKAIAASGTGTTQEGSAFARANIVASINSTTGALGAVTQQLSFTSSTSAFQVEAGDKLANAFMGNLVGSTAEGKDIKTTVTGAATAATTDTFSPATSAVKVRIQGGSLSGPVELTLTSGAGHDVNVDAAITDLKGQVSASSDLQKAGISVAVTDDGKLQFTSARGESFNVMATGDTKNQLGLGSFVTNSNAGSKVDYNSIQGDSYNYATALNDQATLQVSFNGAAAVPISIDLTGGNAVESSTTSSAIANPNIVASTKSSTIGANTMAANDWSAANESFTVAVNGGSAQTVTLTTNYAGPGNAASQTALLTEINNQLTGAVASFSNDKLKIDASTAGTTGSIVVAGTATVKGHLSTGGSFTQTAATDGTDMLSFSVDGIGVTTQLSGSSSATVGGTAGVFTAGNVVLHGAYAGAATGGATAAVAHVFAGPDTFQVSVDGGPNQLITLSGSLTQGDDSVSTSYVHALNLQLSGATATEDSTSKAITITSNKVGAGSNITITDGVGTGGYSAAGTAVVPTTLAAAKTFTVNNGVDSAITVTMGIKTYNSAQDFVNEINSNGTMTGKARAVVTGANGDQIQFQSLRTGTASNITLTDVDFGLNKMGLTNAAGTAGDGAAVGSYLKLGAGTAGAAGNNQLLISSDTKEASVITIAAAANSTGTTYTSANILTAMTTALSGTGVTATLVGGTLTLTSNTIGDKSSLTVADAPTNSARGSLGITAGTHAGGSATAASLQSAIQSAIDTATGTGGTNAHATVTVDADNKITITNDKAGAAHAISVFSGNATGGWFGTGSSSHTDGLNRTGSDMEDFLNKTFSTDTNLKPAELKATWTQGGATDGKMTIASGNSTNFRLNSGSTGSGVATGSAALTSATWSGAGQQRFALKVDGALSADIVLKNNAATPALMLQEIQRAMTAAGVTNVTASLGTAGPDLNKLIFTSKSNGKDSNVEVEPPAGGTSALGTLNMNTLKKTADADLGFGVSGSTFAAGDLTIGMNARNYMVDAGGASSAYTTVSGNTNALAFTALKFGNDAQAITISANGSDGSQQSTTITLRNIGDGTVTGSQNRAGANIDSAISFINSQLQGSNNATLQKIVAVKEKGSSGADQINFMSSLSAFNVSAASTANGGGVAATNTNVGVVGTGSNISILTLDGAKAAVTALGAAVGKLGAAQAAIGRGENQLTYAISLATSQITNFSAAESAIRDTNVAQQAANLSKAQVLSQAAIAAMAQANSAPQAVLSLLRG